MSFDLSSVTNVIIGFLKFALCRHVESWNFNTIKIHNNNQHCYSSVGIINKIIIFSFFFGQACCCILDCTDSHFEDLNSDSNLLCNTCY